MMNEVEIYLKSGQTITVMMSENELNSLREKFKNLAMRWKLIVGAPETGIDTSMVSGYQIKNEKTSE